MKIRPKSLKIIYKFYNDGEYELNSKKLQEK